MEPPKRTERVVILGKPDHRIVVVSPDEAYYEHVETGARTPIDLPAELSRALRMSTEPRDVDRVICAECVAGGQRSTVEIVPLPVTLMAVHEYYDEDGRLHIHDANARSLLYRCSNKHQWRTSNMLRCPTCGLAWRENR